MKYILLAAFLGGLVCCGQQKKGDIHISGVRVADTCKPTFTVARLNEQLESGFKQMQQDSLKQLLADWNKTVKPNTDNFIQQNDTIKAIFSVYKEFYRPLDLLKLGEWEWGNKLNSNCQYVVVQNEIFYSVTGDEDLGSFDWEKLKRDSIENFRPPVNLDKDKVLYLTDEYVRSLNLFLGTESTKLGEGNIMNPSRPAGESEKRYEFLRPYIPILHGHWGGYWHLETHPKVGIIVFNKSLTKAKIDFRVGYQGGAAVLEKKGSAWIIKESKANWIE